MPWIKKNLMLVLGGLVGLVLLAGSGFFLYSAVSREAAVDAQLEEKRNEWTQLHSRDPFPDDKNIRATKEEAERIEKLANTLREKIRPTPVPEVTDTFSLRLLIETTISNLTKEAEEAGVRLPDRYAFTFQRLRELGGNFPSNAIPKIAEQVNQIATLARVLYSAKIHSLDTLRRSPVLKDEGGTSDYLTKKSVTNRFAGGTAGVIRTPYDLSFRSFSGELADVLKGLASLDEVVAIKTLNIEPTSLPQAGGSSRQGIPVTMPMQNMPSSMVPGQGPAYPGGMDPALAQRYGLTPGGGRPGEDSSSSGGGMTPEMRSRYGLGPPGMNPSMRDRYGMGPGTRPGMAPAAPLSSQSAPTVATAPPQSRGPTTVLDEKPLRVILQLDFIAPAPESDRRAAPARSSMPAYDDGSDGYDSGEEAAEEVPAE